MNEFESMRYIKISTSILSTLASRLYHVLSLNFTYLEEQRAFYSYIRKINKDYYINCICVYVCTIQS